MFVIDKAFDAMYKLLLRAHVRSKKRAYIENPNIILGDNVQIYETTSLQAMEGAIQIGQNSVVRGRIVTLPLNGTISIGKNCYIGQDTQVWSEKRVIIGDNVLIAHNVNIFDSTTHPLDAQERREQFGKIITTGFPKKKYNSLPSSEVVISDNVWIGCNAIILKGVHIGENSIIAAGSVVTKDVPPNVMMAGNPACVVRNIEVSN